MCGYALQATQKARCVNLKLENVHYFSPQFLNTIPMIEHECKLSHKVDTLRGWNLLCNLANAYLSSFPFFGTFRPFLTLQNKFPL